MAAQLYTQEQLDIELLKQQSSTMNQTLNRIERRLENVDTDIKQLKKEIKSEIDTVDKKIDSNFKWTTSFMVSGFVGILGIMAHGFKWF